MQYATQGAGNAKKELIDVQMTVSTDTRGPSVPYRFRFVNLAHALTDPMNKGMGAERSKWIATSNARVYVFTGDPQGSQFTGTHIRVWAAVEVDASGQLVALLRVADGYHGDRNDYANYETEAFQRLNGGRIS